MLDSIGHDTTNTNDYEPISIQETKQILDKKHEICILFRPSMVDYEKQNAMLHRISQIEQEGYQIIEVSRIIQEHIWCGVRIKVKPKAC